MFSKSWLTTFHRRLNSWFEAECRQLPWRQTKDPYRIWLSEIMLQQTQVKTVIPYYERFIAALPTIKALADANLSEVLKLWEGLGYYTRARNLHKAAGQICRQYQCVFPHDIETIKTLAGIGPYTAAAIHSIAFGGDHAVVDGNVQRVLARIFRLDEKIDSRAGKGTINNLAHACLAHGNAGTYNQAIMELGALICRPRRPRCDLCPLQSLCLAFINNDQNRYPLKLVKKAKPHHTVAVGIVYKGKAILITQRPYQGMLGGLWEFPGGKLDAGRSMQDGLIEKIGQHIGIKVNIEKHAAVIQHGYTHFSITMHAYICSYKSGRPQRNECIDFKWISAKALSEYAFPRSDQKIIEKLFPSYISK